MTPRRGSPRDPGLGRVLLGGIVAGLLRAVAGLRPAGPPRRRGERGRGPERLALPWRPSSPGRTWWSQLLARPRYGRLAAVPLADPSGARALGSCAATASTPPARRACGDGLGRHPADRYAMVSLDSDFHVTSSDRPQPACPAAPGSRPTAGSARRPRFITGHSYLACSSPPRPSSTWRGRPLANLETSRLPAGRPAPVATDANFWGVTFASDNNTFYATPPRAPDLAGAAASRSGPPCVRRDRRRVPVALARRRPSDSRSGSATRRPGSGGSRPRSGHRGGDAAGRDPQRRRPARVAATTPRSSTRCPAPGPRPRRPTSGRSRTTVPGRPRSWSPTPPRPRSSPRRRRPEPARPPRPGPGHHASAATSRGRAHPAGCA